MTSLEYLISHCKDDEFSPNNIKVQDALCALAEDMKEEHISYDEIENAMKRYINNDDIKKCLIRIEHIMYYIRDYKRPICISE